MTRGTYAPERKPLTVKEVVAAWLTDRAGHVKERTHKGYRHVSRYVTEPLLLGTSEQRAAYTVTGKLPSGTRLEPLLGHMKVSELTTADIRSWHKLLTQEVGAFTANRAKLYLAAATRPRCGRPPHSPADDAGQPGAWAREGEEGDPHAGAGGDGSLSAARQDPEKGIYYAFPFLTGTRPSEQLALLWEDVDFDKNVDPYPPHAGAGRLDHQHDEDGRGDARNPDVRDASRDAARVACPLPAQRLRAPPRVPRASGSGRPGPSRVSAAAVPCSTRISAIGCGRRRSKALGLPYVTPHSARHSFISTLQAQGIEVGLVAKLAGHSNAVVTLGHYTQAVRGGAAAMEALERVYTSLSR